MACRTSSNRSGDLPLDSPVGAVGPGPRPPWFPRCETFVSRVSAAHHILYITHSQSIVYLQCRDPDRSACRARDTLTSVVIERENICGHGIGVY